MLRCDTSFTHMCVALRVIPVAHGSRIAAAGNAVGGRHCVPQAAAGAGAAAVLIRFAIRFIAGSQPAAIQPSLQVLLAFKALERFWPWCFVRLWTVPVASLPSHLHHSFVLLPEHLKQCFYTGYCALL